MTAGGQITTSVVVPLEPGWAAWRGVARSLLARDIEPERVQWSLPGSLWHDDAWSHDESPGPTPKVSKRFMAVAERVAHHRDEVRAPLLYRVLWRLLHGEPHLLDVAVDADVVALMGLDAAVRRSVHHTQAFVRFRRVESDDGPHYIAWYRPEHPVLPLVGDFFARRFSDMRWTIMTPEASLAFDGEAWSLGPGQPRTEAPDADALEALWRSYYSSTFNPARLRLSTMKSQMPKRHWATLPETAELPGLIARAAERVEHMLEVSREAPSASRLIAASDTVPQLASKAAQCTACPLHGPATQVVFGAGMVTARIMIVGEQPGDTEDRRGEPFCGPAGKVLDRALLRAGLSRAQLYLTNAVKHFHFVAPDFASRPATGESHVPQGKRRLHARPHAEHVRACRPWLIAELERIRPDVLICMGTTAARSVLGATVKVERDRGRRHETPWAKTTIVTFHPSAALRAGAPEREREVFEAIVMDLVAARRCLEPQLPDD